MESKQNQNQLLFSFIKQEAYFTVNYKLVKHIGLNPSIFFGEICNEFKYYYEKNLLINDDWFFATTDKIQSKIGFSKFLQSNCIKILQDCKILEMKIMGIPAKKHFKINGTELIDLMEIITQQEVKIIEVKKSNNLTTRSQNTLQQEVNLIDNKKSNNLTTIYKEQNIKNKHKEQKNNIKKENVFVEPTTEYYSTTDFTENQQSTDIILDSNTNEVVVERNKQYSQNDLITDEHMVLDCFVEAGISVFNDGQFGFGSQLVDDVSLAELYDKTAIMQWGKFKILYQKNTLAICEVNNATYKQLYNVIYQTFQKGYKNLNYINSYLDKELKKINQLTYSKNDNTTQTNTNISGSNQQEQFESEGMFCPSGRGITISAEESKKRLIEDGRRAKEERDRAEQNT